MRHAPVNLVKEEPSARASGAEAWEGGLVVESAVEASNSIAIGSKEEAFFDGDADGATDWGLAAVEEGLEGVLGVEKAPPPS